MEGCAFLLIAENRVKMSILVTGEAFLLHRPVSGGGEEWVLARRDAERMRTRAAGALQSALRRLSAQVLRSGASRGSFLHDLLADVSVC